MCWRIRRTTTDGSHQESIGTDMGAANAIGAFTRSLRNSLTVKVISDSARVEPDASVRR